MADVPVQDQAPPDVAPSPQAPDDSALTGGNPVGAPAAPKKESFLQGFARGGAGESYAVDAQGNMTNARVTAPSGKGLLGSILAGAVLGALHGASAARPGGIPSEQLGGGAGAGAKAATDFLEKRDLLKRQQAEENFTRQQSAQKMTREQAESAAQINHYNALSAQVLQATKFAEGEHALDLKLKEMSLDKMAEDLEATRQSLNENNAKFLSTMSEMGFDPVVVAHDYNEATPYAPRLATGELMAVPNGVRGEGHGASFLSTENFGQPLPKDETFNTYTLDPKTGKVVATPQTLKKGTSTGDYVAAVFKANSDLKRILDFQQVQSVNALRGAQAEEAREKAGLDEAQVEMYKHTGINVPQSYVPNPNAVRMSKEDLMRDLSNGGVTVPGNFADLYAVGHYKSNISGLPSRPYNRPGQPIQMSQTDGKSFILNFINPNYDEKNYKAVQELETQFASTRPNTAGGDLLSFNRSVGHLGQLYDAMQALKADGQTQVQTFNRIANALSTELGHPVVPNFNAIKNVLVGELGRTFSGKAPDIPEMATLEKQLSAAQSPEQIKDVLQQYSHALLTKGGADIDRYYQYTGELPPSTFSTATKQVFDKMGINPAEVLPEGAAVPVGGVGNVNAGAPSGGAAGGGATAPQVPPPVQKALANQPVGWHQLSDGTYWYKAQNGAITVGSEADFKANKPR